MVALLENESHRRQKVERGRLTVRPGRRLTKMAAECWASYLTGIAPADAAKLLPVSGSSLD